MPTYDAEISWQVLQQIVREWAGSEAELAEVTPLYGGCINTTLRLVTSKGDAAVLKITPHRVDRSYADEELQLGLLHQAGVPSPHVYRCKTGSLDDPFSYILMEFVEGVDLAKAKSQCDAAEFDLLQGQLAEHVLKIHAQTADQYMRVTAEEPKKFANWAPFYRATFEPIWHEVEKSGVLPVKCRKQIGKLHERLDRLLPDDDRPRLTHWDLWSANVLAAQGPDGHWHITSLLDPHCKFAHAEAEIAYLELFHTVTPAFLRTYQQAHRLSPDYHRIRRPIYQLYSLLNHLRLFGQEYVNKVVAAVERVV